MLETTGLACERGSRRLFSDLSFALGAGGLLHVRGANGSGKTSLLRILAGLARAAAGTVLWRGKVPEADFGREMLFLGHAPALKEELTAQENLEFACRLSGLDFSSEALRVLGVERQAGLPARFLSQGQKKRVGLARLAVAGAMPLWLLDEPFSALDDEAIAAVRGLIEAHLAAAEGKGLDDHDVRPGLAEGGQQHVAAARLEGVVDRSAVQVGEAGEAGVARDHRRQRDMADAGAGKAGNRRAAGDHRHVEAVGAKRLRDPAGAGEVADAEQVLDVEEDAGEPAGGAPHQAARHSVSNRSFSWRMLTWWSN